VTARASGFWSRFLLPGGLWLLLLFAIPLLLVLALSFGFTDDLGRATYAFELDNYSAAFDSLYIPVLLRSVGFALATVALCLLLGYPIAYYIALQPMSISASADSLRNVSLSAPCWIPNNAARSA
jgi:spermidine/putrescine transport system permease protein